MDEAAKEELELLRMLMIQESLVYGSSSALKKVRLMFTWSNLLF